MRRSALRNLLATLALVGLLIAPAASEAKFWGGFYENYPDVDWLTLETEHFRIHYYPEIEWTARMMAKYAEIAYPKVTGMFDYPLKEKVHIVLRDQEENANGFAVYNSDHVTVWATPLYYILRGRQEWIPDCFAHEFSHIISLKVNDWKSENAWLVIGSGLVEDGVNNIDFGARIWIGFTAPFWWSEGIAEYGTHMAGFNWWTTSRDMHLRMAMLEDNYLSYDEMGSRGTMSGFDGEKGYQQGYSMALYVMEKFGKEQYAQLAVNSNSEGHLTWDKNLEDVLGVDGRELFNGYLKWMKDRYARQVAPIEKEEHAGADLFITSRAEEVDVVEHLPNRVTKVELGRRHYEDPEPADEEEAEALKKAREKEEKDGPHYEYWDRKKRKAMFEKGGVWNMLPTSSPDGKWTASAGRQGVILRPVPVSDFPVFSGHYWSQKKTEEVVENTKVIEGASMSLHGAGYTWTPDSKKILFASTGCPGSWLPCHSWNKYQRYDLFSYDIESEDIERLTDELRAFFPAMSPDGQNIAFVHIEDGQNWLGIMPANAREVTIDGKCEIDGKKREKCIKWLIRKRDGTNLGVPSWSPDGSKIVLDLYRNHQQDVWMINADGTDLHPLTWDKAEDRDGHFTPDGKSILYASDRTGIFNAYLMNLETREVKQLTNVIGGVYSPSFTPDGDLIYAYFTALGLRLQGLKKENFYNKVVDAGYEVTPEEVARNLAYQEPLPEIRENSESYNAFNPKNWGPIDTLPMLNYESRGINLGVILMASDVLDKHNAYAEVLLGQSSSYRLIYINNMWYAQFIAGWVHVDYTGDFAQGFDGSEKYSSDWRLTPHFDQPLSYKYRQSIDFGMAGVSYDFGPEYRPIELTLFYSYRYYTSVGRSDEKNDAFLTNNSYSLSMEIDRLTSYRAEGDINPHRGYRLSLDYTFTRTGLPEKSWADVEWLGRRNPPGDHSDDYLYHELTLGYTHAIPISWWNPSAEHTLEFHLRAGWENRNVQSWDEFFAGSLHPLRYVPTQSTTYEFSGYEDFSLAGETMLVMGLSYRFPLARGINKKVGPFYFVSVWGELFGTAGNLWGYTAEYERDIYGNIQRNDESYWDAQVRRGTARRERPFIDIASKNGNYMLYDVGFALKLKAYMFNTLPWNSFIRVSYGLNDIIGSGEVNDDRVYVDVYPNNSLYAESEPKSLRVSIGIGSSFQ